jgi:hypothetical protein
MTPLSDSTPESAARLPRRRVARPSHATRGVRHSVVAVLLALGASGCLVSDPPTYHTSTQTTPELDAVLAAPSPRNIIDLTSGDSETFNVPVRSEDAGDDLWAMLHLNYLNDPQSFQVGEVLPASSFEDVGRTVNLVWLVPARPAGCYRVTLIVTHASNIVDPFTRELRSSDGTAMIDWWANLNGSQATLDDCPRIQDPGTDAGIAATVAAGGAGGSTP